MKDVVCGIAIISIVVICYCFIGYLFSFSLSRIESNDKKIELQIKQE